MKVLIVTGFFSPHNTPRAFRSSELALELARRGIEVDVVNAIPFLDFDYDTYANINIININEYRFFKLPKYHTEKSNLFAKSDKARKAKQFLAKIVYYFTAYTFLELYYSIIKQLKNMPPKRYDLTISIGLPVQCHFAVSYGIRKKYLTTHKAVADYGDPFSVQQDLKIAPYFKYLEKRMLSLFDYVTVPISSAVDSYLPLVDRNKIKVIPQGFDFSKIVLSTYTINSSPTFGFAGNLYLNVRNPSCFLDYLGSLRKDFIFIVYTSLSSGDSFSILKPYIDILGSKLVIRPIIPREEVLFELSKMDFLINCCNKTNNQSPSKLIDYALTRRPILDVPSMNFHPSNFEQFLLGNYENQNKITLSQYDIKNVCDHFLKL